MTAAGAVRIAAAAACLALVAFVVALALPAERSGEPGAAPGPAASEPASSADPTESFEARGAPDAADVEAAVNAAIPEQASIEDRQRNRLVDAPRELIAYAASCGELRAIAPRRDSVEYEVFGESNACAPGWSPDGRLALVGPLGRPPGSTSALWLLSRNGGTEVIEVPERSVNGRPAFWDDRTVDMCTVSRRALRPAIYRREFGRTPELLTPGCFPTTAPDGRLAYAAPDDDGGRVLDDLRVVRVVDREGTVLDSYALREPIVDVRFTGDGSRVVVVTSSGSGMTVTSFGGARPRVLQRARRGALSIYPSPVQADIGVVRTVAGGVTRALLVDARSGSSPWSRGTDGVTRMAFGPDGQTLLLVDEAAWLIVGRDDGQVRAELPRLGGDPAWCCPTAAAAG